MQSVEEVGKRRRGLDSRYLFLGDNMRTRCDTICPAEDVRIKGPPQERSHFCLGSIVDTEPALQRDASFETFAVGSSSDKDTKLQ